jgi:hypothetical protein
LGYPNLLQDLINNCMKNQLVISFVSGLLFLSACSPQYYSSNTQNVPLISQKGETNLTFGGNDNQLEFQGAYGVTNGFAIQASGGFFIPKNLDNGDGGSGRFFELGGGYFKPLPNNFVFETYGLFGMGHMENHFPSTVEDNPQSDGKIAADLFRYGVQPGIGYKTKYFTGAFSSRIVHLQFYNINGNLIYNNENQVNYLSGHASNFLIEPAITLKGGIEKIKLQIQVGRSFNLSSENFKQGKGFMTVGLNFNFN